MSAAIEIEIESSDHTSKEPRLAMPAVTAAVGKNRILELDGLRALAAINLMLFHLTHVYSVKFGYSSPLGFEWPFGAYGVELFFILSGYLNAMSLLRRGDPSRYLSARFIRIVPIFLIVIVANLLIVQLPPHDTTHYTTAQWIANLTLVPRLLGQECIDPVMWTLQVEMMFYGLLTLLFVGGLLRRPIWTWSILLALSLLVCRWVDAQPATSLEGSLLASWAIAVRGLLLLDFIPLFAIGFMLYLLRTRQGSSITSLIVLIAGAAVFHHIDHGKHNPAATVLIVATVALASMGKIPPLRIRPLVFVSTISYALYLCHNNLGCALIHHFDRAGLPSVACLLIAIVFSLSLATIVTTRVEQPITRAIQRALSRRVETRTPVAAQGLVPPG